MKAYMAIWDESARRGNIALTHASTCLGRIAYTNLRRDHATAESHVKATPELRQQTCRVAVVFLKRWKQRAPMVSIAIPFGTHLSAIIGYGIGVS